MKKCNKAILIVGMIMSLFRITSAVAIEISDINSSDEEWLERCETIKKKWMTSALKSGLYSKVKENISREFTGSSFNIDEILIPTIVQDFSIEELEMSEDTVSIFLKNSKYLHLVVQKERVELMEDLWGTDKIQEDTYVNTKEGIALTQKIYGAPIDYTQITIDSFRYTPEDISCRLKTKISDLRVILSLEKKMFSTSNPQFPKVTYFENRFARGFLEYEVRVGMPFLGITLITPKHKYLISYYLKENNYNSLEKIAEQFYSLNYEHGSVVGSGD